MIHKVFTIYDSKSEAYLQPFFLLTRGQAVRAIRDCVSDRDHQFGRHPEDYTLFELGTFDDSACAWELEKTATVVAKLIELVPVEVAIEEAVSS